MKIYKLSQEVNIGYDTYSDCVVIAESTEDAKTIHPNEYCKPENGDKWDVSTWAPQDRIMVEDIGIAHDDQKRGVVCASFNAG